MCCFHMALNINLCFKNGACIYVIEQICVYIFELFLQFNRIKIGFKLFINLCPGLRITAEKFGECLGTSLDSLTNRNELLSN